MKTVMILICLLFAVVHTSTAMAKKELTDFHAEAAEYYEEGNFKKAYKTYYKLAKIGDHKSQYWVAQMYARGEGKDVDLEEAYAWAYLAAESGNDIAIEKSTALFESNPDKAAAQKRADKLMKKYGKEAQEERAARIAQRDTGRRSGSCVGSRLTCQRGSAYDAPITSGSITGPMTVDSN
jgi:TPR repeat protein